MRWFACVAVLLGWFGCAVAQVGDGGVAGVEEGASAGDALSLGEGGRGPRVLVWFGAGAEHRFEAGIDEGGDVSVTRAGAGVDVAVSVSERLRLSFGADHVVSDFDFESGGSFVPGAGGGELLDPLARTTGSFGGRYAMGGGWGVFGSVGVRASVESGADFGDGVEVSGLAGLSYRVDGSLTVAGGVLAGSRIEDDARVVPLIGFDWAFAEGWRLSSFVGRGRPADRAALSGGLSVDLSYEWCDAATVFVRGVYESERFALDDDNAASPGGVFDREAVSVTGGVDWTLGPGIDLRVFGGVSVYQELDFEDGGGRDVASSETDPQPSVGATLVWRF